MVHTEIFNAAARCVAVAVGLSVPVIATGGRDFSGAIGGLAIVLGVHAGKKCGHLLYSSPSNQDGPSL